MTRNAHLAGHENSVIAGLESLTYTTEILIYGELKL